MKIYLTRHGQSLNNVLNIIGGNSSLTIKGKEYGKILGTIFNSHIDVFGKTNVWTSDLKRTKETAKYITNDYKSYSELNEIHSGIFEHYSINTIKKNYPDIFKHRNANKYLNTYPEGENYIDLKIRIFPLLQTIDMTKDENLLIIGHQAVCRVIFAYFTGKSVEECVNVDIDLHTLYRLDGKEFTCVFQKLNLEE